MKASTSLIFYHLGDGEGYSASFIFETTETPAASAQLGLSTSPGSALALLPTMVVKEHYYEPASCLRMVTLAPTEGTDDPSELIEFPFDGPSVKPVVTVNCEPACLPLY